MSTMSTTAVIQVDLQIPSISMIYAKQFDSLSRFADIRMLSGGQPWNAGTSVTYAVQYSKADGTKGMYDKLPDGITNAVTAETDDSGGTVLRVRFAPQMFTVPGKVKCSIAMIQSDGTKLQTFSIYVVVEESEVNGDASEDYYKMTTLDDLMKAINSVNSSLTSLSKKAVKSVNGVQPDTAGNVEVAAGGLQIVRAVHGSDDVYTATGDALPSVVPGSIGQHTGKGSQIVFIPGGENTTAAPKLQLNGGSKVQIRMRAPRNQWDNSQSPDATLPVPVGALMAGVPYTMTFCGLYWLIDSFVHCQTFVVEMTKSSDGTITVDKTFAQIKSAYAAGQQIVCACYDESEQWDDRFLLPLESFYESGVAHFGRVIEVYQGIRELVTAYINSRSSGDVYGLDTWEIKDLPNIPTPTKSDAGKTLTVDANGNYVLA